MNKGFEIRFYTIYLGIVFNTADNTVLEISRLFWVRPDSLFGFHGKISFPDKVICCPGQSVRGTLPKILLRVRWKCKIWWIEKESNLCCIFFEGK